MGNFLTPEAIIDSINGSFRDTLSLVEFQRTAWLARVRDAGAIDIIAKATGADPTALNASKYLFDGTSRHKALVSAINSAYTTFRANTSGASGMHTIPNSAIGDYLATMDKEDIKVQDALKDFQDNYDADVQIGIKHLGTLGEHADLLYKKPEELAGCFRIKYDGILPFPDKSQYGEMGAATLTRLQMNLEGTLRDKMQSSFDAAMKEFLLALDEVEARLRSRYEALAGEANAPKTRITSAVINAPIRQARMLRQFARGEWSERMLRIENALETILHTNKLSTDAEVCGKAHTAIEKIAAGVRAM